MLRPHSGGASISAPKVITLTLPAQQRRDLVLSFWLTLSALAAVPWLALAWWLQTSALVVAGLGVTVLIGLMAFVHEGFVLRVYGAWNRRLVRPFGSMAARVVMGVCFFVVFVAAGRAGSRMSRTGRGGTSAWGSRASLVPGAYRAPFAAASSSRGPGTWMSDYLRWARQTGNLWAVSLLPFLVVLNLLPRDEETSAVQANIYTLF